MGGDSLSESVSVFSPVFPPTLESHNDYILCIISGLFGSHTFQASDFEIDKGLATSAWVCACVWVLLFFPNLISSFLSAVIRAAWQGLNLSF